MNIEHRGAVEQGIPIPSLGYRAEDICVGADPFLFQQDGAWHLLIQENFNEDPFAHDGIRGYSLRSASIIEGLVHSTATPLLVDTQPKNLKQVWAAEIHFGTYM